MFGNGYEIKLRDNNYYITDGMEEYFLCKNTPLQTMYIDDIAQTFVGNIQRQERMDSWQMLV